MSWKNEQMESVIKKDVIVSRNIKKMTTVRRTFEGEEGGQGGEK